MYGTSPAGTGGFGASTTGRGLYGASGSGTGVEAFSGGGMALKVAGRADFSRSGKATIAKGASSVRVAVPGGVTSSTLGFANLRVHRAGVTITAVIPVTSSGKLWIRLNKAAPAAMSVSWFALR